MMPLSRRAVVAGGLAAGLSVGPAATAAVGLAPEGRSGVPGFTPEGGFDEPAFRDWVAMRTGTGQPVYWYSEGTMRSSPSGKLVALMEGFDTAIAHWPEPGQMLAHQYNRKIYIFRDPATGAVVGDPIAYPYQFITYRLAGDRVETMVEQGSAPRVQKIGPGGNMAHRRMGPNRIFTAPVFLDIPLPGNARMQAFENYDFVMDPSRPPSSWALSWMRTGAAPAWAGGGPVVLHLVTRRHERFADLPEGMRRHVQDKAPLWQKPPADLSEIRRLQAG